MGLKKRKDAQGVEYEYITYDRDAKATFNTYSATELTAFRTLMRSVGGSSEVAYELYKLDNSYTENSQVYMHFVTIEVKSYGGKLMVLTPEEIATEKWMFEKEKKNKNKEFEYTEVARDSKRQHVRDYFFRNPYKIARYCDRVNASLNWNRTGNKDTKNVVKILNKLALKLHNRKKSQFMGVSQWLIGKEDKPEQYEGMVVAKKFIDKITATSKPKKSKPK